MQAISMRDVRKSFGEVNALASLSFEVEPGEIFGFLGPSGAGKTTAIKLLTRQLKPDGGGIEVFGTPAGERGRAGDDETGVLTDSSGLYERLSVWDNLALFASIRGVERERIGPALESVGLYDDRKKAAKKLSRGMKQRLMLAQVMLHRPRLLYLDEPTASLDPATTADIHRLLLGLNAEGTTIFLTTHNMEEADRLCNRVAFLHLGRIVELGKPEELKLKYSYGRIRAVFTDGEALEEDKTPEGLARLAELSRGRGLAHIHSLEPNLEEIFLKVTGRALS